MTEELFQTKHGWALFLVIMLVILAAVIVAGVEALAQGSSVKVEAAAQRSPKRAVRLGQFLAMPEAVNRLRFFTLSLQFGSFALVTYLSTEFFESWWAAAAICVGVLLLILFTETIPRSLGYASSDSIGLSLAGILFRLANFFPIRLFSGFLLKLTDMAVPGRALRYSTFDSPEELVALADAAVEDEILEPEERDLIESIIEFGDTIVREVMTPRPDMKTVPQKTPAADALELASVYGFSRMPVIGDSSDDVVGLAYVKDLIKAELSDGAEVSVEEVAREAVFIPETKKVSELLQQMQKEQFHLAIAVDEYGGIAGLVTLEDLIEEIVGEIVDEYDTEEPLFDRLRDGAFRVDARIPIDEVNDLGSIDLPEGGWDTVGGLVFDSFGRVPSVGETIEVEGHRLEIERVQGRRISRVRISRIANEDGSLGATDE